MATKTCPQCAESVQAAAKVCRYCGASFPEKLPTPPPSAGAQFAGFGCLGLIGLAVFLLFKSCSTSAPPEAPASQAPDAFAVQAGAEAHLKAALRDPDSVQFRGRFVSTVEGGGMVLCGELNSKNGFGGFTGYKHFIASPNADAPTLVEGESTGLGEKIDRQLFPEAYKRFCSHSVQAIDVE